MIGITVLGSTGSIGVSTLDVVARHPGRFRVIALTACRDVTGLAAQCEQFNPGFAVMSDPEAAGELGDRLAGSAPGVRVLAGPAELETVAALPETDAVMAGIVGAAGLLPTLAAVRAGKRVLLANKEALVMSGALFMDEIQRHDATLIPVDSEHNAVFQCFPGNHRAGSTLGQVRRIVLTASGGPFRDYTADDLEKVTPDEACDHPNWDMGRKISVDSATLMNKGLEVIEAHWLFGVSAGQIDVVVHPQSIVHSMVEYVDGSVLAHLGNPDMRTPIAHALAWPERVNAGVAALDVVSAGSLSFEAPDMERFPCLKLGYEALEAGGTAPAVLNAANEVAVEAFLAGRIRFTDIARVNANTRVQCAVQEAADLKTILSADRAAREHAASEVARLESGQVRERAVQ